MESQLFLVSVLLTVIFGHNSSLTTATVVVVVLKPIPYTAKWLLLIQHRETNWDVTVTSVAILIPTATRQVGSDDLWAAFKIPAGWIVVGTGTAVTISSKYRVNQLAAVPQVTVALVLGTIIGVVAFREVATDPAIVGGTTYRIVTLLNLYF